MQRETQRNQEPDVNPHWRAFWQAVRRAREEYLERPDAKEREGSKDATK